MRTLTGTLVVEDLDAFVEAMGEIADTHDVAIQVFDARYVAGPRHLERAVDLANRAFDRGENVARDRAVEMLCYAAGRRQIDRALEMGLTDGENRAVFVIDGSPDGDGRNECEASAASDIGSAFPLQTEAVPSLDSGAWEPDADRVTDFFGITEAEREATDADLEALVCERVALLEVEK